MYNRSFNFQGVDAQCNAHNAGNGFRRHCGRNFSDIMNKRFGKFMNHGQIPVNIQETEDSFILHLFAAGRNKELFSITFKEDNLTISYPSDATVNEQQLIYSEYKPGGFERIFRVSDRVLADQISATYTEGVLEVTLPKNPETNQPGQNIVID